MFKILSQFFLCLCIFLCSFEATISMEKMEKKDKFKKGRLYLVVGQPGVEGRMSGHFIQRTQESEPVEVNLKLDFTKFFNKKATVLSIYSSQKGNHINADERSYRFNKKIEQLLFILVHSSMPTDRLYGPKVCKNFISQLKTGGKFEYEFIPNMDTIGLASSPAFSEKLNAAQYLKVVFSKINKKVTAKDIQIGMPLADNEMKVTNLSIEEDSHLVENIIKNNPLSVFIVDPYFIDVLKYSVDQYPEIWDKIILEKEENFKNFHQKISNELFELAKQVGEYFCSTENSKEWTEELVKEAFDHSNIFVRSSMGFIIRNSQSVESASYVSKYTACIISSFFLALRDASSLTKYKPEAILKRIKEETNKIFHSMTFSDFLREKGEKDPAVIQKYLLYQLIVESALYNEMQTDQPAPIKQFFQNLGLENVTIKRLGKNPYTHRTNSWFISGTKKEAD